VWTGSEMAQMPGVWAGASHLQPMIHTIRCISVHMAHVRDATTTTQPQDRFQTTPTWSSHNLKPGELPFVRHPLCMQHGQRVMCFTKGPGLTRANKQWACWHTRHAVPHINHVAAERCPQTNSLYVVHVHLCVQSPRHLTRRESSRGSLIMRLLPGMPLQLGLMGWKSTVRHHGQRTGYTYS
jgi:hypothetical protein